MLRDAISVPGISRISLFKCARDLNVSFPIFGPEDHELHNLFQVNKIGGPSIIFHRYHEKGKTYIKGNKEYPFAEVVGFDANNLYGYALSEPLCCGPYVLRHEDDGYYPHKREQYMIAYHYLDWISHSQNVSIDHKMNTGKEHRVGGYLLDGFNAATQTCWEFHGCYHHAHEHLWEHLDEDDETRVEMKKRRKRTAVRTQILRDHGLTVIEKWYCEFKQEMAADRDLRAFVASRQPAFFQQTGTLPQTVDSLLDGVRSGVLYGFLEVDIHCDEKEWTGDFRPTETPEEYYSEFPPLFCSADIPFSEIGEHMQTHVRETQLQEHLDAGLPRESFQFREPPPRRLLVGGLKAERLLLHTDLLSWYLEHGLHVTRIYRVIEFHSARCFKPFIDEMTELRRKADKDPDQSVIADTAKLLSNSSYGSLLMQKEKHQDIKYVRGKEQATRYVKSNRFKTMTDLTDDLYELHMQKQSVELTLPSYLGVQVLQIAKLTMLRFVYGFLFRCCKPEMWQIVLMDTDSIYIAHSGVKDGVSDWREIIREEFKDEYRSQVEDNHHVRDLDPSKCFFLRSCCDAHKIHDKRQPALMKTELEKGICYVGLASKTYWIATPKSQKFSSKGLQKDKLQEDTGERYMRVLTTGKSEGARNVGFRAHQGTIFTYSQYRKGLPYYYCKREVLEDGVSTRPLKITLNPWK